MMTRKPLDPLLPEVRQNFLDRAIGWVSPKVGNQRMLERIRMALALQYKGASVGRLRSNWILGEEDPTPDIWELETLRNRSRDLNRNDPIASGATDTMGFNIVGRGLRPQARIRADRLGISESRARKLCHQAEMVWEQWIPFADSGNRLTFDEIQFVALRKIIEDGEVIGLPVMATEPWREIKRCIELVECNRLMSDDVDDGITVGSRGQPVTYHIKEANSEKIRDISALDIDGRPNVLHVYATKRPGQKRGVPFLAPVLNYFKDLADYLEAEVVAARIAACLAVFITKNDAFTAAYNLSAGEVDANDKRVQQLEPGMIGYLKPGEAINTVEPKRPGDSFESFITTMMRIIGISLGLPYEVFAKDFSKTNYSSARAALLEARRMFMTWRQWFAARFCQPVWNLVMEEAFLRGKFKANGFYNNKAEYCRCAWIGGGWGWVDPVKEVEASRKAIDFGLSTLAEEVAGQGRDWEEVLEQLAHETDRITELDVKILRTGKANGGNQNAYADEE